MAQRLTQEEFIRRCTEIHKGKYDYSKVEYKTSKDKVCIVCPIHGEFWQKPTTTLEETVVSNVLWMRWLKNDE